MVKRFLRVSCKDCGNETVIFERASTIINCGVCGALLAEPAGGTAKLVGCEILEALE
jgi:small subunit ribosomal protein S27e